MKTEWLREIDSTNSELRRRVAVGTATPPFALAADVQLAGRGRSGNSWFSPSGCLMFSALLDPMAYSADAGENRQKWPQVALVAGLAVAESIQELAGTSTVELKWPNDLYLQNRKLCGILVETLPATASGGPWWCIGIGLNVDIDWDAGPDELREKAICIHAATGLRLDRRAVLDVILEQLSWWIDRWSAEPTEVLQAWQQRCFLTDRIVTIQQGERQVHGRCEGIDLTGSLLVRDESQLWRLQSGTVLHY